MNAKAGYYIFPNELLDLGRSNGGDGLSLYPLCEVVHSRKEVLMLTRGFREGSQYVHTPGGK